MRVADPSLDFNSNVSRRVRLIALFCFAFYTSTNHLIASYHTAQEFSNTAWALATLHSKRGANTSPEAAVEDDGIVHILRWVSKFIIQNVDSFKPQELSNR